MTKIKVFIISADKKLSKLIEIELLFRYREIEIIKLSDLKQLSANYGDSNNLIILDLDSIDEKALVSISTSHNIISFGRNNTSQSPHNRIFMSRPFLLSELCEKVSPFLSAETIESDSLPVSVGKITLLPNRFMAIVGDNDVYFSETEFNILKVLYDNRGRTVSRDSLAKLIKNDKANSVEVYICMLRKKIDFPNDKRYIRTIRGKGYMLHE